MHKLLEDRHGGGSAQYIKSVVFGGLDGILTIFAVSCAAGDNPTPVGTDEV